MLVGGGGILSRSRLGSLRSQPPRGRPLGRSAVALSSFYDLIWSCSYDLLGLVIVTL